MIGKSGAVYAVVVGVLMLVMWTVLYFAGEITEIQTAPLEISVHVAAELLASFTLIAGGVGLLRGAAWGLKVYYLAMGMLIYTVINSSGYYAQSGDFVYVLLFAVLLALAVYFTAVQRLEN